MKLTITLGAVAVLIMLLPFAPAALGDHSRNVPIVHHGIIRLTEWPLEKRGVVELRGDWSFYPHVLQRPQSSVPAPTDISVPSSWAAVHSSSMQMQGEDVGTYRLRVDLSPADVGRHLSIAIPAVATADRVWVNGEFLGGLGTVQLTAKGFVPQDYAATYSFTPKTAAVDITIEVANFAQRKGGLWAPIDLGTAEQIAEQTLWNNARDIAVMASLFVLCLYHLVLFVGRPRERENLYVAGLCFTLACRTSLQGQMLFAHAFSSVPWTLETRLEYLTAAVALPLLVLLAREPLKLRRWSLMSNFSVGFAAAFSAVVLFTPVDWFTHLLLVDQAVIVFTVGYTVLLYAIGYLERQPGFAMRLLGSAVFFAGCVNDTLYYDHRSPVGPLVSFGWLGVLLFHSIQLSSRFAKSMDETEVLAAELSSLNQSLEVRIRERTRELESANARLQALEKSRRALFDNISHDMGAPLTAIRGSASALLSGMVQDERETWLRLIHSKTILLERLLDDLSEVARMEAQTRPYSYTSVWIRAWMESVWKHHELQLRRVGLVLALELALSSDDERLAVHIDETRMDQVFQNLLGNAAKFSPPGGTVTIRASIRAVGDRKLLRIAVVDSGPGIAEEDLPRIFDRYYRASTETEGTGLGLAIVREIIASHHGEIQVSNHPSGGAVFTITLEAHDISSPVFAREAQSV